MAVFRIEKTRDYTVMANHHLKNRELTLKAKGLMSVLLSLPDDWDYTLVGLSRISREGVDAIREAVKELERAGYVIRNRVRNEKGQLTDTEYVIYEQPRAPEVAADSQQPDSPALEKPVLENPTLDNPILENPTQDKPTLDFPALDKPTLENPMQLNTHRSNTHRENIDLSMAIGDSITIVTDVNGEITTGWLEWGRYRIEETAAPEGFLLTGYSTEVNAYENGKTYSFEVENEPMSGFIQMEKTDHMTGQPIAGVQFDIYDTSGDLAGTMTTNDDGIAISPPLRRGDYSVVEHENPTGYVHELVELNATVMSDETTYLAADNQPIQGKIRIVKKDQLTGDLLTGAEFTITRVSGIPAHNGAGNGEVVAVITTNENGVAETPLLTYGTYKIEETVVPEHFVDNGFSVEVTISDDNLKTYEVVVENEPAKGWLKLTKTNSLDGHPIAGVTFNVYYYDDYGTGLACTMTTDENGFAISPALRKGRYSLRKIQNVDDNLIRFSWKERYIL